MFEHLEARRSLTANQWRIIAAAIIGDMLEFFDYFLIGFVLAFIVGPWQLSFGQSAIILLSSGIGAILGAAIWGRLADRIGRRPVLLIGLAGSVVFYALFGIATVMKHVALLFVARIGAGILSRPSGQTDRT